MYSLATERNARRELMKSACDRDHNRAPTRRHFKSRRTRKGLRPIGIWLTVAVHCRHVNNAALSPSRHWLHVLGKLSEKSHDRITGSQVRAVTPSNEFLPLARTTTVFIRCTRKTNVCDEIGDATGFLSDHFVVISRS